jgi:hypothetical protein
VVGPVPGLPLADVVADFVYTGKGTLPPRKRSAPDRWPRPRREARDPGPAGKGGTIHSYVVLPKPQDWFTAIDFTDVPAATARIAQEFGGAPELTALITGGDIPPVPCLICALPAGHRWDRVPSSLPGRRSR